MIQTAGELAQLRADVERETLIAGAAVIVRETLVSDGRGGDTATESRETVAGRYALLSGPSRMQAQVVAPQATHVVTLEAGADVTEADRIEIDGKVLHVRYIAERTQAAAVRVYASEG